MIKLIVEHINSKIDINGNRYWIAKLTSTKTGKKLMFKSPHSSNTIGLIDLEWNEMHVITTELPIREFNSIDKCVALYNSCKDEDIKILINKLIKE